MIYELRIYDAIPGKLPALNERFQKITGGYFEKHGIKQIAYWTDMIGTSNRLTYIVRLRRPGAPPARLGLFSRLTRSASRPSRKRRRTVRSSRASRTRSCSRPPTRRCSSRCRSYSSRSKRRWRTCAAPT